MAQDVVGVLKYWLGAIMNVNDIDRWWEFVNLILRFIRVSCLISIHKLIDADMSTISKIIRDIFVKGKMSIISIQLVKPRIDIS